MGQPSTLRRDLRVEMRKPIDTRTYNALVDSRHQGYAMKNANTQKQTPRPLLARLLAATVSCGLFLTSCSATGVVPSVPSKQGTHLVNASLGSETGIRYAIGTTLSAGFPKVRNTSEQPVRLVGAAFVIKSSGLHIAGWRAGLLSANNNEFSAFWCGFPGTRRKTQSLPGFVIPPGEIAAIVAGMSADEEGSFKAREVEITYSVGSERQTYQTTIDVTVGLESTRSLPPGVGACPHPK